MGATPPAELSAWKFEGNTGRTTIDVLFPTSVASGATVWFTAFWFNPRKQQGPACDPVPVLTGSFTKRGLLESAAACARREYCLFQGHATTLRDRVALAAAEPSEDANRAARDAWLSAIASWQEAEVFNFGPASPELNPGGLGLRDLVYSLPLVARCKVDEQTVSRFYEREAFFGTASESPSSGRTLHALE